MIFTFLKPTVYNKSTEILTPFPQLSYFNFQAADVVSLYRDPQLQVGKQYAYTHTHLFNLRPNIYKSWF